MREACWGLLQVRQEYGVKKDLLGLLEGRETYVIGKDGIVKMVSPSPLTGLLRWYRRTGGQGRLL